MMSKLSDVFAARLVWFLAQSETMYHSWVGVSELAPAVSPVRYCRSSVASWVSSRETWRWEVSGPASTYTPSLLAVGGLLDFPQAASPTASAAAHIRVSRRRSAR